MKTITACRICGSSQIQEFLSLGVQPLSGVFPSSINQEITSGPLRLVRCPNCSLIQLGESYSSDEMYGDNYGYRSGLNPSMVNHLASISRGLKKFTNLTSSDIVLDIGSNDGTFLSNFQDIGCTLVGIDPTITKHEHLYLPNIRKVSSLFSAKAYQSLNIPAASLVTSIAMFYDLEDPISFASEIKSILKPGGVWFFEQSYAPWMQSTGAYDTICHEHLEYYSLTSIKFILDAAGLELVEVTTNSTNGGSISVLARNPYGAMSHQSEFATWLLSNENTSNSNSIEEWLKFGDKVVNRKNSLNELLTLISSSGKSIYGLGASTKGNVLLNYSEITPEVLPAIGEINVEKWGKYTPGTGIPIENEQDILNLKPDYLLFLPWHFREFAVNKYSDYLSNGGKFIFPLPEVEVIGY
jgi:hypothetical protein